MYKLSFAIVSCFTAVLLSGCGGGSGGASVKGTVTHNGEKVKSGTVTFTPVAKEGTPGGKAVTATIKEDGSYSVDGATVGKNRVLFAPTSSMEPVSLKPGETVKAAPYHGLVAKEAEVEVTAAGNSIEITLIKK